MKKNLQQYLAVVIVAIMAMVMVQCKKNNREPEQTAITEISPLQGLAGTLVTVNGTAFDTVKANTSVSFNGLAGVIKSVTPNQITALVPKAATSGQITVTNKNVAVPFTADFTVKSYSSTLIPASGIFVGRAIKNIAATSTGTIYANTGSDTVFIISPLGVKSMLAKVGNNAQLGGIAVDATGNVYTVGTNDFKIYKITTGGAVSVFAGSGASGHTDAQGTAAQFTAPVGMAIDASGNLFVTDVYRVRKITPAGLVSTFAGGATAGKANGQGTAASFGTYGALKNIATDAAGNVYVSDGDPGNYYADQNNNYYIRRITAAGNVSTIGPLPTQYATSPGAKGPISLPFTGMLAIDAAGNFFTPGSSYNNGFNATGGCCNYGSVFMVNKALTTTEFFDFNRNVFFFTGMNFTAITFDASGNMYASAAISYGHRFYEPPSVGTVGSMILKFKVQ